MDRWYNTGVRGKNDNANGENGKMKTEFDFERTIDAEEWAHRKSLIFDTDAECQAECERLLATVTIRDRDE